MSALDIYAFYRDGDAFQYDSVKNSWGGGMAIWIKLTEKYKCKDGGFGVDQFKDLWDKCTAGELSDFDTKCCLFTFDWVWVKKENAASLGELLVAFNHEHSIKIPTLLGAGKVLGKAGEDDNIIGVAFNMSSVGEGLWYRWSEEADEATPYNVLKGGNHWELFEEFDKIRKEQRAHD